MLAADLRERRGIAERGEDAEEERVAELDFTSDAVGAERRHAHSRTIASVRRGNDPASTSSVSIAIAAL
mgnify:CR=1 FL=1